MRHRHTLLTLSLLFVVATSAALRAYPPSANSNKPIAKVNSKLITEGEFEFEILSRRIKTPVEPEVRQRIIERLIDQELMSQFLRSQEIKADLASVAAQEEQLNNQITLAGKDPKQFWGELGFTQSKLRSRLEFASMRESYLNQIITEEVILKYFEVNREKFDNTRYRARQIFLALPPDAPDAAVQAAEQKLLDLRKQIVEKQLSFEDAAKQSSEAPSAKDGGDVGFFPYRGKMSAEFSAKAFEQELGEVGMPFRTRFGMHLVQLTEHLPGQFSLEDVRTDVTKELRNRYWDGVVLQQRAKAKIERMGE